MKETKIDLYEQVTSEIIALLEKGEIAWLKGWNNNMGLPSNPTTNREYTGWNSMWLNFVTVIKGYTTPFFLTYKQAKEAGGFVKKDEEGHRILFANSFESKTEFKTVKNRQTGEESRIPKKKFSWKIYHVFNIDQTEGIPIPETKALRRTDAEKITACEQAIEHMPLRPRIEHTGDQPAYYPQLDLVRLPPLSSFISNEEYYSAAFHELGHATGHPSRLNRPDLDKKDEMLYALEEVVAEFTAVFVCAACGIEKKILTNTAAYIQFYLDALKNDKQVLVRGASQAQKAADYILNRKRETAAVADDQDE